MNDPQVLDSEPVTCLEAIFASQDPLDTFEVFVQITDNAVSIVFHSRGEDINVVMKTHNLQKLEAVRTNVHSDGFLTVS